MEINVVKRSGKKEPLNIEKVHRMVEEACKGLTGVSSSHIEMNSGLQFYDSITTEDIQKILIKSASDLISLDSPNYQYAAARLLLFSTVKKVFGKMDKNHEWFIFYPSLKQHIDNCVDHKVYDPAIKEYYTQEEIDKCDSFIKHERDKDFTYAGLQQVVDKYLVQDRINGNLYETPQFMYMLIAMTIFHNYPEETRLQYVKKYYDAISTFKISLPTPIIAGVRTNIRQYASCVLIDVGDSLPSIFSSASALGYYVARRAGIGLNFGRIRGIGSRIRNGEVVHTGVIPYLKVFEATVKSTTQNGIRGGCFSKEAETLVVDSVEIDGIKYDLFDEIDGISVFDIINNHNGNEPIMEILDDEIKNGSLE
jgi:ribonucleoside-diphosphate reductase alpha chain